MSILHIVVIPLSAHSEIDLLADWQAIGVVRVRGMSFDQIKRVHCAFVPLAGQRRPSRRVETFASESYGTKSTETLIGRAAPTFTPVVAGTLAGAA